MGLKIITAVSSLFLFVLMAIYFTGCGRARRVVRIGGNNIMSCDVYDESTCGVRLERCSDGHRYLCVTNIEILGDEK